MAPSKPSLPAPSDAGGRAADRREASSSSSSPPPPPPPPQQQGHASTPVPLTQASLPVDHEANVLPFGLESPERRMGELYLTDWPRRARVDASRGSSPSPRDGSGVYGHDWPHPTLPLFRVHHDEMTRGGASSSRQEQPGPIPPPHPQFVPLQQRYAAQTWPQPPPQQQQRYAAQTWPQLPHYGAHFGPQPPQCYAGGEASSSRSEEPEPPIHEDPRLEEFKAELLLSPTRLEQLLMSRPESSAFVVHLLHHGGEEMRHCVLAGFEHRAHDGEQAGACGVRSVAAHLPLAGQGVETHRASRRGAQPRLQDRRRGDFSEDAHRGGGAAPRPVCVAPRQLHGRRRSSSVSPLRIGRNSRDAALIRHALDTINDKLESELGTDFKVVCEGAMAMAMG